jgi:uncharacterized protein
MNTLSLKLTPEQAGSAQYIDTACAAALAVPAEHIKGTRILKRSIDARSSQIWVNLLLEVYVNEPVPQPDYNFFSFQQLPQGAQSALIIGAGPAGYFAALQLIQKGIKPIIIDRGKDVRTRRRDLAILNKEGIINPESNYCFGEGGAGTYSDGKLYTRSNKRGNIDRILKLFVQFGASEQILTEAHPHIGTNKLPHIITAMRQCIEAHGGQVLFDKKLVDFTIENDSIKNIITSDGDTITANAYILATGHSARDVFELFQHKKLQIEAKPFALGVRVEHPQVYIDQSQYRCSTRGDYLPPASYSLVQQVNGKGVFSFCMCPGGIIATASTNAGELVVNGWSPSKRNNPYANSGMVVEINNTDLPALSNYHELLAPSTLAHSPLAMMQVQKAVEQKSYIAGGGHYVAPAQRLVDFCNNMYSQQLPECSYIPGLSSQNLHQVLPPLVAQRLALGFKEFGKKIRKYYTNDAVIVATESRTSSPVKIPRNIDTLTHPQLHNLYPCGEGAGYAGGIVSAAMDGERCALAIAQKLNP